MLLVIVISILILIEDGNCCLPFAPDAKLSKTMLFGGVKGAVSRALSSQSETSNIVGSSVMTISMPSSNNVASSTQLRTLLPNPTITPVILTCDNYASFSSQQQEIFPANGYVREGEAPWQVRIESMGAKLGPLLCGGALIDQQNVLTAASCLPPGFEMNLVSLYFGDRNRNWIEDGELHRTIKNVTWHPKFSTKDKQTSAFDIAVVRLDSPIPLSTKIAPICISKQCRSLKELSTSTCFSTGWKTSLNNDSVVSSFLEKGITAVLNDCSNSVRWVVTRNINNNKRWNEEALNAMICTGPVNNKNRCQSEIGGPLVCEDNNNDDEIIRYYLEGILTFHSNCNAIANFDAFLRPCKIIEWILAQVG